MPPPPRPIRREEHQGPGSPPGLFFGIAPAARPTPTSSSSAPALTKAATGITFAPLLRMGAWRHFTASRCAALRPPYSDSDAYGDDEGGQGRVLTRAKCRDTPGVMTTIRAEVTSDDGARKVAFN